MVQILKKRFNYAKINLPHKSFLSMNWKTEKGKVNCTKDFLWFSVIFLMNFSSLFGWPTPIYLQISY